MPATYTIEIFNQSGVEQDYTLFPARPLVSGSASGEIWSHVVSSQKAVPNGASVTFEVTDNYYAFCGHYDNPPTEGAKIVVEETVPVTLGTSYGTSFTMGSTVNLTVLGGKASKISTPVPPGKGKLGNFVIDTTLTPGNEFKIVEAKQSECFCPLAANTAPYHSLGHLTLVVMNRQVTRRRGHGRCRGQNGPDRDLHTVSQCVISNLATENLPCRRWTKYRERSTCQGREHGSHHCRRFQPPGDPRGQVAPR